MFLLRFAWPLPNDRAEVISLAIRVALVIAPLFCGWSISIIRLDLVFKIMGTSGGPPGLGSLRLHNWKALSVTAFEVGFLQCWNLGMAFVRISCAAFDDGAGLLFCHMEIAPVVLTGEWGSDFCGHVLSS